MEFESAYRMPLLVTGSSSTGRDFDSGWGGRRTHNPGSKAHGVVEMTDGARNAAGWIAQCARMAPGTDGDTVPWGDDDPCMANAWRSVQQPWDPG